MSTRILALVGSLRAGSDNLHLAEAAVKLAPSGISVEIFDGLADVALYNEDIDRRGAVAAADRLRAEVQCADALLLVTPEYNGTMSAALKNAIDWISRRSPSRCRKSWPLSPPRSPVGMTEAPANECATLLIG